MRLISLTFILFFIRGHFISCSINTEKVEISDNEVFPGYLSPNFLIFAEKYIAECRYSGEKDTVFRHLSEGKSLSGSSEPKYKYSNYLINNPTTYVPTKSLTNIPDELLYMPEACVGYLRKWNLYHGSLYEIGAIIGWASRLGYIENIIKELKLSKVDTSYVITPQDDVLDIPSIETISSKSLHYTYSFSAVNLFKMLYHLSNEFEQRNFYKNIIAMQLKFEPFGVKCTIGITLKLYDQNAREVLNRCFHFNRY